MPRARYLIIGTPTADALSLLDPAEVTLVVRTVKQLSTAQRLGFTHIDRVPPTMDLVACLPLEAVWVFRKKEVDRPTLRLAREKRVSIFRWYAKKLAKKKDRGRLAGVQGGSPRGASMKEAMRCPQKFANTYILPFHRTLSSGFEFESTHEPFARGDLIHQVLANHNARLKAKQDGTDPDEFLSPKDAYIQVLRDHRGDRGYTAVKKAVIKPLQVYMRAHQLDTVAWEIVAVEAPGTIWVSDEGLLVDPPPDAEERLAKARRRPVEPFETGPYPHTFRRDLLTRQRGKLLDIDYKSTRSVARRALESTTAHYMGDLQLTLHHLHAKREFGAKLDGSYIQMIEMQSPYRFPLLDVVGQSRQAMLRAPRTVLWFEGQLRTLWATMPDPRYWPVVLSTGGPCVEWGGTCPFYRSCRTV